MVLVLGIVGAAVWEGGVGDKGSAGEGSAAMDREQIGTDGEGAQGGAQVGEGARGTCSLLFEDGARLDGVRVAENEEVRTTGLRGVDEDSRAMLFRWTPARGRTATMQGVEGVLGIAWLGVNGEVVGVDTMREGGEARYRFDGWTAGAIEAGPGVLERTGIGEGSRLAGVDCGAVRDGEDFVRPKKEGANGH